MGDYGQVFGLFLLGAPFLIMGVLGVVWCAKNGQFSNLEASSRSIFSEDEPEGLQTDFFPKKK